MENAEKANQYVLLKMSWEVFCNFFSVFIQIGFPGLTASVMFLVKGFQSEEWMLMTALITQRWETRYPLLMRTE